MNYNSMFDIPIFKYKIKNWTKVKATLINQFKNSLSETINNSPNTGGQLHTDFFKNAKFSRMPEYIVNSLHCMDPYIKIFLGEVSKYYNKPNNQVEVTEAWFQKQEKNMLHGIHNHGAIGFSSICYVKFDKDVHSPTTFIAPFNDFIFGDTHYYQPEVEEGDVIFFPSSVQHYSPTNSSNSNRIIFSYNLK